MSKTYTNAKQGFAVDYPESWGLKDYIDFTGALCFEDKKNGGIYTIALLPSEGHDQRRFTHETKSTLRRIPELSELTFGTTQITGQKFDTATYLNQKEQKRVFQRWLVKEDLVFVLEATLIESGHEAHISQAEVFFGSFRFVVVATPINSFSFQPTFFPKHELLFDLPTTFTGGEPKIQIKAPTKFALHYFQKFEDKNVPLELKLLINYDSLENIPDLNEYIRTHNLHLKMQQRWSDQELAENVKRQWVTSQEIDWTLSSYRDTFGNANVIRAFARKGDEIVVVTSSAIGEAKDTRAQPLFDHILKSVTFTKNPKTLQNDYSTYINFKYGYQLKYHKSFEYKEAYPAVMFHDVHTKNLPYGTNFTVIVEKQDVSLEEFLEVVQKSFEDQMAQYTLVEDVRTTYLGLPAQRRVHQARLPNGPPLSIKNMQIIAKSPDTAYAVSFGAVLELYDEALKNYGQNLFDSLHLISPATEN